jgi:hypothetical protein
MTRTLVNAFKSCVVARRPRASRGVVLPRGEEEVVSS